eukprot:2711273-Pyramimonas_sp.AAC.1
MPRAWFDDISIRIMGSADAVEKGLAAVTEGLRDGLLGQGLVGGQDGYLQLQLPHHQEGSEGAASEEHLGPGRH